MLLANGVAVAAFLLLGSRFWMSVEEAQNASFPQVQAGMAWGLLATVVVVVAIIADVAWIARQVRRAEQSNRAASVAVAVTVAVCWAAAYLLDAAFTGVRIR
jgi:heme/copper-type cytochrome/quinol oxidase subunit 2